MQKTRRDFVKGSMGAVVAIGFPAIVPASVFGQTAPSNRINVGAIGVGRISYDAWLGSTPEVYYTEMRVHPQDGFSRPGWLRCEQFGAGMITGWGAHHVDTAHWGMNTEYTGPVEVWGTAEFPTHDLWDVHGNDQHGNWLECIKSRKAPAAPAEIGHRACCTCLIHHIAMKTKRRLSWDPIKEHFKNDDEANCMLSRPQRAPYMMDA